MAPNCEKHPTLRGIFIIYDGSGFAWRARKCGDHYRAIPSHAAASSDARTVSSQTRLRDLAAFLADMKREG